jgi:uncharacterized protein YhaN
MASNEDSPSLRQREQELLERLREAERLLSVVPDLERELAEAIDERNAAIMELEQGSAEARPDLQALIEEQRTRIAQLESRIRMMETTRVWRTGVRFWTARDRLRSVFGNPR